MKEYKKINGLFICEECDKIFYDLKYLKNHITRSHDKKIYYDKWIKDYYDDKCKICGKTTPFRPQYNIYQNCCSKFCNNKYNYLKTKESHLKKYGVENSYQRKEIIEKIKITNLSKSDIDKKKIKEKTIKTNTEKYGVPCSFQNLDVRKKFKSNFIKKYGVENPYQSEDIKNKIKNTNQLKYGVDFPTQNREIIHKGFKSMMKVKNFRETNILYGSSYELDFLEKFYHLIDIENGKTLSYFLDDKNHFYHSDFYIPSLNYIIEIKSSWTLKLQSTQEIEAKLDCCKLYHYNFIMILDKNYDEFQEFIIQKA